MTLLRDLLGIPTVKRLVCLANSRKYSGRCIAGKERHPDGGSAWIRPVSSQPTEELSPSERQYRDAGEPELLDVVEVALRRAKPKSYQSENWLIAPGRRLGRVGRATWDDLRSLADDPPFLWTNNASTAQGINDRVAESETGLLRDSLYLLHLQDLRIRVSTTGASYGDSRRRVYAAFTSHGVAYRLSVTDPSLEQAYLAGPDGEFRIGECFATVSLGEPFNGYCYKLVAAVITRPAATR